MPQIANRSNDDRSGDFVETGVATSSVTGELSGELPGAEQRVPKTEQVMVPNFGVKPEDHYNGP